MIMATTTYTENLILDINSSQACPVVSAKQGDTNSRQLIVQIQDKGSNIIIDNTQTAAIRIKKPDRNIIFNNVQVNSNGTLTVTFTYECLNVAGRAYADIVIFDKPIETNKGLNAPLWSTVSFIIDIMASPHLNNDNDSVNLALSSDEFLYLKSFIDRGNVLYNNAQFINFGIDLNKDSETRGELLLYSTNTGNETLQFGINDSGYLVVIMP